MDILDKLDNYNQDLPPLMCENERYIKNMTNQVKKIDWDKAGTRMKKYADNFVDFCEKAGIDDKVVDVINKRIGTKFRKLRDIIDLKLFESPPIMGYDADDVYDVWDRIKTDLYNRINKVKFHDTFMDINKMMGKGGVNNPSATLFYTLLWIAIQSGKITKK